MSEKRGLPLCAASSSASTRRSSPREQLVGEVVQINAMRHSPFVPRIKTGVAGDLLVHDVDLAIRFVGNAPAAVKGSFGFFHKQSQDNGSEDSADATCRSRAVPSPRSRRRGSASARCGRSRCWRSTA